MSATKFLTFQSASGLFRIFVSALLLCTAAGKTIRAQVISAPNLTPFEPRDVGTTSKAKTVRVSLNHPLAINSIVVAPGFTDFGIIGSVTGCVIDGHTVNPAFTGCQLQVTFQPKYPDIRTAPLIVTDNTGAKYSVGLSGIGLSPQAALTPGITAAVAGIGGAAGFGGDGGPAVNATLNVPGKTAVDSAGNFYIADRGNYRVRKVDTNGIITTFAGNGKQGPREGGKGDGGPALDAELVFPSGVVVDPAGNVYIADGTRIRKVDVNGIITTFAGTGASGFSGDGGPAIDAELSAEGLTFDEAGNLYFADTGNERIRKIDTKGIITTVAGNGIASYKGDGGPATSAELNFPEAVAVDAAGNLYIDDYGNDVVRKVDVNGVITTAAGIAGRPGFSGDGGPAVKAHLYNPVDVATDSAGNLYIADAFPNIAISNNRIRRVDVNGTITTVAGNGGFENDAQYNYNLPATETVIAPSAVALDSAANLYISDYVVNRIVKVNVSQSAAPFAAHKAGTTSPNRRIVLTNTGNQHLDLTGSDVPKPFGLLTGNDPSYCTPTTGLGPGFSCALPITFTPPSAGPFTDKATITDNSLNQPGTTQSVSLSGSGVSP